MSLDLVAVLMNPQVDLNRLLRGYIENQEANYRLEVDLVAREVIRQRDHYADLTRALVDRVADVDIQEAPSDQIALLRESLEKIKSFQETQKKAIEQNQAHLEEAKRHKQALLASYEEYRKKLGSAEPRLPSERAFYRFANAATTYVACQPR
jgi:hypothetical protein